MRNTKENERRYRFQDITIYIYRENLKTRYASIISQISYTCEQNKNWFHAECEAPFLLFIFTKENKYLISINIWLK